MRRTLGLATVLVAAMLLAKFVPVWRDWAIWTAVLCVMSIMHGVWGALHTVPGQELEDWRGFSLCVGVFAAGAIIGWRADGLKLLALGTGGLSLAAHFAFGKVARTAYRNENAMHEAVRLAMVISRAFAG